MRLVVDASLLVGQLLREKGRRRLADPRLELFIPEQMLEEVERELPKRVRAFARAHDLEPALADELGATCLEAVAANVAVVHEPVYAGLEDEAQSRSVRDPNDWPLVASALALSAGIWTADDDLLGVGIATWTVDTLDNWLRRHPVDA